MATFNWESIDDKYPVAGVDNDTQGFRDNFGYIKNALQQAESDVDTLQQNTVKLNTSNNFLGNTLVDVNLSQSTGKVYPQTGHDYVNDDATTEVSWTSGHYQLYGIRNADMAGDTITISLVDWPLGEESGGGNENRIAKITLDLTLQSDPSGGTFNVQFLVPGGTLYTDGSMTSTVALTSENQRKLVEFWTWNGGVDVYGRLIGTFTAV